MCTVFSILRSSESLVLKSDKTEQNQKDMKYILIVLLT